LRARLGCYFILGNHDWEYGIDPDATRVALSDLGWQDTGGQTICIEHNGHTLAIGGSECPWMGEHPDFSTVPHDAFRLLLSHTPDNLPWARQQGVDLMLSGHNHGGQVVLPVIGPVYSPSRFGVRFAGGVYWHEPTLLYVTRGISGQYPLRLNCKPELTKVILRAAEANTDAISASAEQIRESAIPIAG
jgi:predicted MPP superfamily phosphohydrolase